MIYPDDSIIFRCRLAGPGCDREQRNMAYIPAMEWSSESTTLHGVPIATDVPPLCYTLKVFYPDDVAPLSLIVRGRRYDPFRDVLSPRGFLVRDWRFYDLTCVLCERGNRRDDGEHVPYRPHRYIWGATSAHAITIAELNAATATIARVIDDGYDYDALRAALCGAGDWRGPEGDE